MRSALLVLVALGILLAAVSGRAQERTREQALQALTRAEVPARRAAADRLAEVGTMADMPALVKALRDPDEDTRDNAAAAMWRIWARSGDPAVDRLYETGIAQMNAGDLPTAIATFSRIIAMKPDFAEAWNKRATLHYLAGDMRRSLADCDEVVKRNPYHFGALSGYALIYIQLERYDRALEYSRRALEVNPNLESVRENVKQLEHIIEERRKRAV